MSPSAIKGLSGIDSIIGMTEDDARKFLETNKYSMRVMNPDMSSTCDLRTNRINVRTVDGKVVNILGCG